MLAVFLSLLYMLCFFSYVITAKQQLMVKTTPDKLNLPFVLKWRTLNLIVTVWPCPGRSSWWPACIHQRASAQPAAPPRRRSQRGVCPSPPDASAAWTEPETEETEDMIRNVKELCVGFETLVYYLEKKKKKDILQKDRKCMYCSNKIFKKEGRKTFWSINRPIHRYRLFWSNQCAWSQLSLHLTCHFWPSKDP